MRYFHAASTSQPSLMPVVSQVWPMTQPASVNALVASVALFQNAPMFCLFSITKAVTPSQTRLASSSVL